MKELLWKDWRLNRMILVIAVAAIFSLFAVGAIIWAHATWPELPSGKDWAELFILLSAVALFGTSFIAAMLGGYSFAYERADRSAYFLSYLPPTKGQILLSKFLVALGIAGVIWLWPVISMYVLAPWMSNGQARVNFPIGPGQAAAMSLLTFGVAWLASVVSRNTTGPIVMGIVSPGMIAMLSEMKHLHSWDWLFHLILGTAAFVAGCVIYSRQVEP